MSFIAAKVAGDELPASHLDGRIDEVTPLFARKTADESVSNATTGSTLQNDDELFVAVAASTVYRFECLLHVSTSTTADFKTQFTVPSGATVRFGAPVITVAASAVFPFSLDNTIAATIEGSGVATFSVQYTGLIVVSSTAGTMQLQWAQSTADASSTTVKTNSFLWLQKMA